MLLSFKGDIMRHTLKAVFDHRSDAQHVLEELLASGYLRSDTTLSSTPPAEHAEGLGASVRHALERLFGPWQHKHPMAHVVTLTAGSDPDAERAVGIMQRFGPVGIEDLPDDLDQGSVGTGIRGAGTGAAGMSRVYPPGTEPGALQNRASEDSHYFGTQNAGSPPTGNTYEEMMGADSQWAQPDLGVPRARRDDEMAAYRYGKEMRASDKYSNRSWDEVEPSLKGGWEARDTSASTWDESKAAVRRGWDSTSADTDL
jgi:hypothetical protein